jgi:hypothetical protein
MKAEEWSHEKGWVTKAMTGRGDKGKAYKEASS